MTTTARTILRSVLTWPVASQQRARRNALVASTAIAQQRHERLEVERFLDEHARRRTTTADGAAHVVAGGAVVAARA